MVDEYRRQRNDICFPSLHEALSFNTIHISVGCILNSCPRQSGVSHRQLFAEPRHHILNHPLIDSKHNEVRTSHLGLWATNPDDSSISSGKEVALGRN